jgi:hypothetical protein
MALQFAVKTVALRGPVVINNDSPQTISQQCAITTTVVGNTYSPKFDFTELVTFNIPMSLTVSEANTNVQEQAAAYVASKYPNIG